MNEYFLTQAKQQWPSAYAVHVHNCYFLHKQQGLKIGQFSHGFQAAEAAESQFGQQVAMCPSCSGLLDD